MNNYISKKIFLISIIITLVVSDTYPQTEYSSANIPLETSFKLKSESSVESRHSFSLGPGITSKGFAAFGIAYKFEVFKNFRLGLNTELYGARVNNDANAGAFLLTGITPEYRVYNYKEKFKINIFAGLGFIAGMYPIFCISPGFGAEYSISRFISLTLEPKYLIIQQNEGSEMNGLVLTRLNINFNF